MERATAVVRSTHSANFYEIPIASPSGSTASSSSNQPSFASTWGPSTTTFMSSSSKHRITNPNVDLNASFHSSGGGRTIFGQQRSDSGGSNRRGRGTVNADEPQFQPAFAFDVNELVSSLRRSASSSSLAAMGNSSALKRSGSSHSWQSRSIPPHNQSQQSHSNSNNQSQYPEQFLALQPSDSRIQVVPVDPVLTRRGRRDALSGGENSRSQVHDNQNSIINYNMNRRKKKPIVGMPTDSSFSSSVPPASPSTYPYSPAASPSMPVPPTPPPLYQTTSSNNNNRRNHTPSPPPTPEFRPTTTITTPNGIEYTTEVATRTTRVTSFYEEAFTF